jgi:hypothetical protein
VTPKLPDRCPGHRFYDPHMLSPVTQQYGDPANCPRCHAGVWKAEAERLAKEVERLKQAEAEAEKRERAACAEIASKVAHRILPPSKTAKRSIRAYNRLDCEEVFVYDTAEEIREKIEARGKQS